MEKIEEIEEEISAYIRDKYPELPMIDAEAPINDNVNSPKHYNSHPSGVECIDIVECFPFNVGNIIKYAWRAGLKNNNAIEDLEKCAWYANREIERLNKQK